MLWEGAVTKIGVPSDGVPGGGTVPTIWERNAVEENMATMVNMPLNCQWDEGWFSNPAYALTGHNERFVIGAVHKVWIDGDYLMCSGIIWKDNFPDVAYMIQNAKGALGFSVEVYPLKASIEDDGYEHITSLEFTGLCVAWSEVCAYNDTFITQLVATRNKTMKEVDKPMELTQEMLDASLEKIMATMASQIDEKIKASAVPMVDEEAKTKLEKLEASNAELLAKIEELSKDPKVSATEIPAPSAAPSAQSANPKFGADAMDSLAKINASSMSIEEKAKARFNLAFQAELK